MIQDIATTMLQTLRYWIYAVHSWKESLVGGNKRIVLIQIDEMNVLYFPTGPGGYYMGKYEEGARNIPDDVNRNDIGEKPNYVSPKISISEEDLLNEYGIRIISCEIASPIENSSFK